MRQAVSFGSGWIDGRGSFAGREQSLAKLFSSLSPP
jgi:hypothetical protein